eukprot:1185180-Prorocentrum_minimum.AAC.5
MVHYCIRPSPTGARSTGMRIEVFEFSKYDQYDQTCPPEHHTDSREGPCGENGEGRASSLLIPVRRQSRPRISDSVRGGRKGADGVDAKGWVPMWV